MNRCNYTMSFKRVHKSFEKCDTYIFKQKEFVIKILIICKVKVNVFRLKLTSS